MSQEGSWWMLLPPIAILLLFLFVGEYANAEPRAIVSFNDAEHLAALTDSVVGVCDTTMGHIDSDSVTLTGSLVWQRITCRRLVCVAADWPKVVVDTLSRSYDGFFDDLFPTKKIPGQAIIFYEKVKQ